jgi:hypothetical protein
VPSLFSSLMFLDNSSTRAAAQLRLLRRQFFFGRLLALDCPLERVSLSGLRLQDAGLAPAPELRRWRSARRFLHQQKGPHRPACAGIR